MREEFPNIFGARIAFGHWRPNQTTTWILQIFQKFDLGEQTGHKADPQKVSSDMRKAARDEQNNRLFARRMADQEPGAGFFFSPCGD